MLKESYQNLPKQDIPILQAYYIILHRIKAGDIYLASGNTNQHFVGWVKMLLGSHVFYRAACIKSLFTLLNQIMSQSVSCLLSLASPCTTLNLRNRLSAT